MVSSNIFIKKTISDVLATLIASNFLSNFIAYRLGNYEVKSLSYWILFALLVALFLSGLIFLRKSRNPRKNIWDLIFPIFLLVFALSLVAFAISLGDIYDKNFGKKLLDKIDSDLMRNMIDIYASGANQTLLLKPIGMALVLVLTIIPRFLGALSGSRKQNDTSLF